MIAREVVFKGRVQGVGFRYTARDMARDLAVSGWVKNCSDGSVRMVAEGEEAMVEELIARLSLHFMVREKLETSLPLGSGFVDFRIEY